MSKHVWLTKPSKLKAEKLLDAFKRLLARGWNPIVAKYFSGYWLERSAQGLRTWHLSSQKMFLRNAFEEMAQAAERSGHRYAQGINSQGYLKVFVDHLPLMLESYYKAAGLVAETPPLILADWLEQEGRDEDAGLVRTLAGIIPNE